MLDCILLTGGAGRLGRGLRPGLAACCRELRVLDCVPLTVEHSNESVFQTDLTDPGILREAMSDVNAVVHFAGYPREADWAALLAANVAVVTTVWEAARIAGVGRIVYASSNHAVGMIPRSMKIAHDALPQPDSRYGVTKVFMESVASLYAAKYGVRGFGMRIGHCAPEPSDARMLSHWIHPDDLAALVRIGLEAEYENEIVYGASANARSWWDNHRAETLGYRPRHSADPYAARLVLKTSCDPVAEFYQGGSFAAAEYAHPRIQPG